MDDVAYCYQQAEQARQRALRAKSPSLKKYYEEEEARWIGLARRCDFIASLNTFASSQFELLH